MPTLFKSVKLRLKITGVYLYSVPYPQDTRAMGGPVIEMYITSPQADIIRTQALPLRQTVKEPAFELNDADYVKCNRGRKLS